MIRRSWQFQRWHGDFLIPCWYFVMGTNASNQKLKAKLPSRASERERVCVYNTYNLKYLLRVFWSSLLHTMRYVRMVILTVVFCVCIFVLISEYDRCGISTEELVPYATILRYTAKNRGYCKGFCLTIR